MKYKSLRVLQVAYRIAGAILAILGPIGSLIIWSHTPGTVVMIAVACVLGGLVLGATADLIQVFIDIERNTRAVAVKQYQRR